MQPKIAKIVLDGGRKILLGSGAIVAVVGPNNSGKTHFLRTLVSHLHGATVAEVDPSGGLIESVVLERATDEKSVGEVWRRAQSLFVDGSQGYLQVHNGVEYPGGNAFRYEDMEKLMATNGALGVLAEIFVQFDDAVQRIEETQLKQLVSPGGHQKQSLVQRARESPEVTELIQHYFREIFGASVSYYDRGHGDLGFVLAPQFEESSRTGTALSSETKAHMEESPKIWLQGLGMRSVLGLLLRIFAQEQPILIIDEPEAFLHPPQSSALGSVLREIAFEHNRQLVLSTHDRHILQGLARGGSRKLHIERLDEAGGLRQSASVPPSALETARAKSLIRFSPLMDSLFSKVTVLVENETDAFFYSEALESLIRSRVDGVDQLGPDDFLFLSVGGKAALGRTAELVSSLQSTVLIAADFDVVSEKKVLESILDGVGVGESRSELLGKYTVFLEAISKYAVVNGADVAAVFKKLKHRGLNIENDGIRSSGKDLLAALDRQGIVLCRVGELEDFDPALKEEKGKAEWVSWAIKSEVHMSEEAEQFARRLFAKLEALSPR